MRKDINNIEVEIWNNYFRKNIVLWIYSPWIGIIVREKPCNELRAYK